MSRFPDSRAVIAVAVAACLLPALGGCGGEGGQSSATGDAAQRVYVAPGEYDEYFAFLSGGHSGQVYVYGLPSGRHLNTIPVFTPESASGWGYDEDSKAMLGGFNWGDAHHPGLSETNGDYDGRWLFINDMANARIARIDLDVFKTRQIIGPLPNVSANHASTFVTENTEYVFAASRFSAPVPNTYRLHRRVQEQVQRRDRRGGHRRRRHHEPGLRGAHAALRLGQVRRGQGPQPRLGVLQLLQLGAGLHQARGQRQPERARLHPGDGLAQGPAGRRRRQVQAGRRRQGHRPGRGAGPDVPAADAQVAPRRGHRPVGHPHHRQRQAGRGDRGAQLRELPEGRRRAGLHRRVRRHPGGALRGHPRGRGAGGPGPAAHPVRRPRLRLHQPLPGQPGGQVEPRTPTRSSTRWTCTTPSAT